jgi:ectoine hydroxylase-related dioxygenase (phytanoyl-CoA dioxygenase family)
MEINDADIGEFEKNGVLLLRGVFNNWVDTLRAGVESNMQTPGPWSREYIQPGEPGRFFGDYCNWQRIDQYRDFMFNSPAPGLAAQLMQSDRVRIFHEHVLVKEPGTDKVTPWHHDQPYYCVDGRQVCSMWIPLDPVPIETCPEFVSGSHRWGQWFLPRKFSGVDYEHDDNRLESIPDISAEREKYDIKSWELEPGDAIAFHFLTVHGAPSNNSAQHRRRGYSARWLGDDAVFAQRSGEISPPFPGLETKLKPGEEMASDEFPIVYPKNETTI